MTTSFSDITAYAFVLYSILTLFLVLALPFLVFLRLFILLLLLNAGLNTPNTFFFSVRENGRSVAEKNLAEVTEMPTGYS